MAQIVCPNCNFTKEIPKEKIPSHSVRATCPQCKQKFELFPSDSSTDHHQQRSETGTEPEPKPGAGQRVPPWENRAELGIWKGIGLTYKEVLLTPENFFRGMSKGGMREPLAFGLLSGSAGALLGLFWTFLTVGGKMQSLSEAITGHINLSLIFWGLMVLTPLYVLISMFVTCFIINLCLLTIGGGRHGFEGTFRVVAYSQAAQILGFFPLVGGMIGWIWHSIVLIIGLREMHETSYLRVILALLIPVALVFLIGVVGVILVFVL